MSNHNTEVKGPRIIVAMDFDDGQRARELADRLAPNMCRLKVGNELFTTCGPSIVEYFQNKGFEVFLDLKYHDIPNTVAKAVKAAAQLGVWMVNVHAGGGQEMLRAAKQALADFEAPPLLIAVSVLTSMSELSLKALGWHSSVEQMVTKLAKLSWDQGLDGLVCSALEAKLLRALLIDSDPHRTPVLVTPGIRPAGSAVDDQSRIMTPSQAIEQGSSYLVVGRPITQAKNPLEIVCKINEEISHCKPNYR